ncbi:hypothetical protein HC251_14850 [Iamia sp. SCSIO 61187]|uniref:hypothetical protein n=1 Tax=Iamia sp. SCSIO 61187 TaxID=2722752 RepID=UPI001C6270AF|nr:hypothetical protein [Iamia sp. SCSIO 61187]QYG93577.1 hypothetical protein HC251_14850 [Iamia sp. SCSIO 61187]
MWVLGGHQSDFARTVTKDGIGPHGLVGEVAKATLEDAAVACSLVVTSPED